MIYRLIMLSGPLQGRRIAVEREPMTLGRGADCSIVIPDEEMALQHAVIEHRLDGLFIRDLGSMGSLLVNGREVRDWRLRHGDEVELGRTRFLVQALVQADVVGARRRPRLRRVARAAVMVALLSAVGVYGYHKYREIREALDAPAPPAAARNLQPPVSTAGVAAASGALAGAMATSAPPAALVAEAAAKQAKANEELRVMREDLSELRRRMQELTASQAAALTSAAPAVKISQPAPDPLAEKVRDMLKESDTLIASGQYAQAGAVLDGVAAIAPGTLETYERRARLFEQRGMPERAMEQWLELLDLGKGTPYYDRAASEFGRLDAAMPEAPPPQSGRLKISSIEHHKFPESADFSEMRVMDIILAPVSAAEVIDAKAVRTEVAFYDEDLSTGKIIPARAQVAVSAPKPEQEWRPGEARVVTVTYAVPRKAGAAAPRRERYYGYTIKVSLGNVLQASDARPKSLMNVAGASAGRQPK
jgi:hypothetical protein